MICRIVALLLPLTVYYRPNKKKNEVLISLALGHYLGNLNLLGGDRWWNSTIDNKLGMVVQFGDTDLILGGSRYLKFCLPELFIL
jgi:hypothetical protein